jgi:hypothetical protein
MNDDHVLSEVIRDPLIFGFGIAMGARLVRPGWMRSLKNEFRTPIVLLCSFSLNRN